MRYYLEGQAERGTWEFLYGRRRFRDFEFAGPSFTHGHSTKRGVTVIYSMVPRVIDITLNQRKGSIVMVISPLISPIKNKVQRCKEMGF